jgi:uncharacterized hydantoinase/oxoprolinase family protein
MKGPVLGWDIGGANLKVARIEDGGGEPTVVERPFALWREPLRLPSMLAEASQLAPAHDGSHDDCRAC